MHVQLTVKHAKHLADAIGNAVDSAPEGTDFNVGCSIQVAPGLLNTSEMKSFVKAVKGALSKFAESTACRFELEFPVVHEVQQTIEEKVQSEFEGFLKAERELAESSKLAKKLSLGGEGAGR